MRALPVFHNPAAPTSNSLSLSISTQPIYTSTLQFFKSSKKANKVIKTVVATWESTFEGVELLHLFLSTLEKIRKGLVDQSSKGNECEWESVGSIGHLWRVQKDERKERWIK